MQSVWSDILHSPPAVAAIFAAILALVSGVWGPYVQYRIGKRQAAASKQAADAAMLMAQNAGSREIARLRLAWIDKLNASYRWIKRKAPARGRGAECIIKGLGGFIEKDWRW
jgi:type II secretory pathway pseudopilin PulG